MPSDDEEEGEGGPADEEEQPTSQYRCVTWCKKSRRWRVYMRATGVGKNRVFFGSFDFEDEEEAARRQTGATDRLRQTSTKPQNP